jgi:signal transduction histidine kinase
MGPLLRDTPPMHRSAPPPAWSTALALLAIVGALGAMLLVPAWQDRRAGPVRDRIASVIEPARDEITGLHLALARGESQLRDALDDEDAASIIPAYRAQAGRVQAGADRLAALARTARRDEVRTWADSVRVATTRWERSGAGLLARAPRLAPRTRDAEHAAAYAAALVGAARLDAAVADAARELRGELAGIEDAARRWTATLGVVALCGGFAAVWLGVVARRAARVAAERGRALEAAAESRARFTRGLSHDLKNPLGAIDGYAELLECGVYGPTTDGQRQALGRMRGAVRALLALVDDLLALARAESGGLPVEPRPTDLAALVRELAEEQRAAATAAGLAYGLRLDDALAAGAVGPVATDPARVRQVVGNLLSNAIKYTPRGGAVTVLACVNGADAPAARCVCVRVSDTGPGIPADQREQVFAEFTRLPGTSAPGAGLGLAIARRVARLLGGDLWVDPTHAPGACFVFEIPAAGAPTDQAPGGAPGAIGPRSRATPETTPRADPSTVA